MRILIQIFLMLLPWPTRRAALKAIFKFDIHPTASIGFSIVMPGALQMGEKSRIGSLTFIKGISSLEIGAFGKLGNLNWVTGNPAGSKVHFVPDVNRVPALKIGAHASITHRHLIDCTDTVTIGDFSTFAGWGSQILTHAIDLVECRQAAAPVSIGPYCFIGTRSVFLKGSSVGSHCVVAAGSVVTKPLNEPGMLYGGVPAEAIKALPTDWKYFSRTSGQVD
jgi:acetyltransferase-like isoleucine patch superfamily enzyme